MAIADIAIVSNMAVWDRVQCMAALLLAPGHDTWLDAQNLSQMTDSPGALSDFRLGIYSNVTARQAG